VRRLGRYIFNGLTVLSLLVCLAAGVLWVSRDACVPTLAYHSGLMRYEVALSYRGAQYCWIADGGPAQWEYHSLPTASHGHGFVFSRTFDRTGYVVGAPYWFIFLIAAIMPTARWAKRLLRKRPPPGLCPKCRYDLRATPDRCPECGTVPTKGAL
jgi:hypothetical protein